MSRYDPTGFEWSVVVPLPPDKPRDVPRVDDHCVATGCAKLAASFLATIQVASMRLWLRAYVSKA